MTTPPTPPPSARDLLKIANFRFLWLGQIISNFGDSLTHLTLVLLINRVTDGSTTAIAGLLIALALPHATIGLVAGVIVDRLDRRKIMIVSDLLRGVLVLTFLLLNTQSGNNLWLLYLIAFSHSVVGSFFTPARSAIIPRIIPQEGLLAANSLSQTSLVFFRLMGTAAAGFLVGMLDVFWPAFIVDAATFFISMLFISRVVLAPRPAAAASTGPAPATTHIQAIFNELRQGIGVMFTNRALIGTLVTISVTMLGLGAINVLLTPLIVNDLQMPETWFGALELAQVTGMIVSGSLVMALAAKLKPTHIISASVMGLGLVLAPLALVSEIWHLFPILLGAGLLTTPLNASIATLVQTAVPDELRGRSAAALGATVQVASLISMFAAGAVAVAVGVRGVFIISGALAVLAGLAAAVIFRGYRPVIEEPVLQPA